MSENKRGMKVLTYEMLMGTAEWLEKTTQQKMKKGALVKIPTTALESWRCLSNRDTKFKRLANITNKPEKHFEESVAELIEAMEKIVLSPEAKDIVLKQLAFENATPTFHSLLKTTKNQEIYLKHVLRMLLHIFKVCLLQQPHKARTLSKILLIKDRKYLINQAGFEKAI